MDILRFILLEDNPDDAELVLHCLAELEIAFDTVVANNRPSFEAALAGCSVDLILADYSLPAFDGLRALRLARPICPDAPFIFVSGALGEERAIEVLKAGATDVVLKDRLERLVPAVRRALRERQEIVERKRAEEELRRQTAIKTSVELELRRANERFQLAAEVVNSVIYEWDYATGHVLRGRGLDNLVGFRPDEVPATGEWWNGRIHPDDLPKVEAVRSSLTVGQRRMAVEYRVMHRYGHYIHVIDRAVVEWDGNQVARVIGNTEDITDAKIAEATLRRAKEAAEEASRAKSAFLANMSHEIRTPLGAILGYSELLFDPSLSEEERAQHIVTIQRNGRSLARIIDDILDLSKVEAGKIEVERIEVSLPGLVAELMTTMGLMAQEKGIRLTVETLGAVPRRVITDPTRLRQILVNIVGNAIKFTDLGEVRLRLCWVPEKANGAPQALEIEVSDTGTGIAPEAVHKLFHPFVQADSSTSRKFGGTGLGLALSRRMAQAMGGNVELVRTSLGKGTTFRIRIDPGACAAHGFTTLDREGHETARPVTSAATAPRLDGVRVLLVDDSFDNRRLARHFLALAGASVDTAENGREAIEKAHGREYDVVLMDIQMPEMDGYEATRRLREGGFDKPIVALTAHAMKEEQERCLRSGFDAHLSKPLDRGQLYRGVAELAGQLH